MLTATPSTLRTSSTKSCSHQPTQLLKKPLLKQSMQSLRSQRLSPTKSQRQSSWNSPARQPLTQSQPERKSPWKIRFTHESRISRPTTKHSALARGLLPASVSRSQRSGALTTASSQRSQTSKATTQQAASSFLKNSKMPS